MVAKDTLYDGAFIRPCPSPYSHAQIQKYLECIKWPVSTVTPDKFDPNLDNLHLLMYLHFVAFPFSNVDLHYTKEHRMSVSYEGAYERLVLHRSGSWCMGQNSLFLGMLRGLGYRAYAAPARGLFQNRHNHGPLTHLVILVQPLARSNQTYVVDVGYGGSGVIRPLLLTDMSKSDAHWVWGTFPPERHRVVRAAHPASSLETEEASGVVPLRDWHMQVTHSPIGSKKLEWQSLYTFNELEFFPVDIETASYVVETLPGMFTKTIIVNSAFEITLDDLADVELGNDERSVLAGSGLRWVGRWVLGDAGTKTFKRLGARKLEEKVLSSESERVQVLRGVFGINLDGEAEQWIAGRDPELKGP